MGGVVSIFLRLGKQEKQHGVKPVNWTFSTQTRCWSLKLSLLGNRGQGEEVQELCSHACCAVKEEASE